MTSIKAVAFLCILCGCVSTVAAQSTSGDIVVASVNGMDITYSELKDEANSGALDELNLESLQDFLVLYADYKAKIEAAKDQGLYNDPSLLSEYKQYTTQAAYSFWLDNEVRSQAFADYKRKAAYELKTYHVLVALSSNASAQEVDQAFNQINQAKNEILDGESLEDVNARYSSMRGGRSMGGEIPWISTGVTVSEFEDVAYNLDVGELSDPFRTRFGYHIILLQDKRKRSPARLVKHIYVRADPDSVAVNKIQNAWEALEAGEQWGQVLKEYSDDKASVPNNGSLGWVLYGSNYSSDFVDPIMDFDPRLPYSEPFQTSYGYHIIQVDSIESYSSEAEKDSVLMKEFEESPYYQQSNAFVTDYLRKKFNAISRTETFKVYKEGILESNDMTLASVTLSDEVAKQTVFEFHGTQYSVRDLHNYIQVNYGSEPSNNIRDSWFNGFMNQMIDDQMIELTIEQYPEFELNAQNFLNGLAVYTMNDINIWSTATVDTSRLRSIYEQEQNTYRYPERPFYYYLSAVEDSSLNEARAYILNGGKLDSLDSRFDQILVNFDSTSIITQEPYDRLESMKEQSFSEIFEYNSLKGLFWLEKWLPARKMTFSEAFEQLHARFQPQREKEWMQRLRSSYDVQVYPEKLREAFNLDS